MFVRRNSVLFILLFTLVMVHSPAFSQKPWEPYLVKDLNPTFGSDAEIEQTTQVGSLVFFVAFSAEAGKELWATDGTTGGTYMVKDIVPGRFDPDIKELTAVNGWLFFSADDGIHGRELWRSDGTSEGTIMVADLEVGPDSSNPEDLVDMDGILYARAFKTGFGRELLRTDVAADETRLIDVVDGCSGNVCESSYPQALASADGIVFFRGKSTDTGFELWRTDGSKAGTWLVKDITPGKSGSDIGGHNLHKLEASVLDGVVYFSSSNGQHGEELWRTDGTEAGTYMVKDILPEAISSSARGSRPRGFTRFGSFVYFVADDGELDGALWRTDGTPEGTVLMTGSAGAFLEEVDHLANVNGFLWFQCDDGVHGREPWISDGTEQGTRLVRDLETSPTNWDPAKTKDSFPTNFQPFRGQTLIHTNSSLWISDGTAAGTLEVPRSGSVSNAEVAGDKVVFSSDDGVHGRELWVADFAPGGTLMLKDINPGAGSDGVAYNFFTAAGDKVYFLEPYDLHDTDDASFVFFASDGTEEGTVMIKGPVVTAADGTLLKGISRKILTFRERPLFHYSFYEEGVGYRDILFLFDGSRRGLKQIYQGRAVSHLKSVGDSLYFTDVENEFVYPFGGPILMNSWTKVLRSTGRGPEAVELARFLTDTRGDSYENNLQRTGCSSSVPREGSWAGPDFTASNGQVFFNFCDPEHGFELWRTDGSAEGTDRVADINPSGIDIYGRERVFHGDPRELTDLNDTLFFRAYTEDTGAELWKSDGTAEGTVLVQDIWTGNYLDSSCYCWRPRSSSPRYLTPMNGDIFFSADNGDPRSVFHGLWKSDGTEEGTVNVRTPTVSSLYGMKEPTVFNGALYFGASDYYSVGGCYAESPIYGQELWRTDGSDAGTSIVKDIFTEFRYDIPGVSGAYCWGSGATPSIVADNQLLLSASLPETGNEAWRTDGTEEGTVLIADLNPGPFIDMGDWLVYTGGKAYGVFDDGTSGKELWAMNVYWTVEVDVGSAGVHSCGKNKHGLIPVAVMGSADVDVRDIDPRSMSLQGLPLAQAGKREKYLVSYRSLNGDGHEDMIAHFKLSDDWDDPESGMAVFSGRLADGTMVRGEDRVRGQCRRGPHGKRGGGEREVRWPGGLHR